MRRREFLAVTAAAVWPNSAVAQIARRPLIGILFHSNSEPGLSLTRDAFARLGYRDGETIDLDVRVANGSDALLARMAADLVAHRVDAIVAFTTPAALAAKAATTTIPIVMGTVGDAVGSGLVESLARPGGNITGVSGAIAEISGKILGLLKLMIPSAIRFGALVNTADPFHVRLIEQIETASRTVKIEIRFFKVANAGEIVAAFEAISTEKIDALFVQPTLPLQQVIALSLRHRIPTASSVRGFAEAGGLLAYSGSLADATTIAAQSIDRILKGARPADIPVKQPTRFELVLNLKTARALSIDLPPLLLAQADEVIE